MKKETEVIKRGRPPVKESTRSFTVSIRPSEKTNLEKKYGTLTTAIRTLIPPQLNPKQ